MAEKKAIHHIETERADIIIRKGRRNRRQFLKKKLKRVSKMGPNHTRLSKKIKGGLNQRQGKRDRNKNVGHFLQNNNLEIEKKIPRSRVT